MKYLPLDVKHHSINQSTADDLTYSTTSHILKVRLGERGNPHPPLSEIREHRYLCNNFSLTFHTIFSSLTSAWYFSWKSKIIYSLWRTNWASKATLALNFWQYSCISSLLWHFITCFPKIKYENDLFQIMYFVRRTDWASEAILIHPLNWKNTCILYVLKTQIAHNLLNFP